MATLAEQIAALESQLEYAKRKKAKLDGWTNIVRRRREQADDARRAAVVGAVILASIEVGLWPREPLYSLLDVALELPEDRALFGLEARLVD